MSDVGLDDLTLRSPLSTLSGLGNASVSNCERAPQSKCSIYVLDEPTTGLHISDSITVLDIVNRLSSRHTVIGIEPTPA